MAEFTLSSLLISLLNGVSFGMILALVAMGLALIWGLMEIANFAHGNFYALGAYFGYSTYMMTGNFFLALAVGFLGVALSGLVVEPVLLRRMYARPPIEGLLLMYGVLLIIFDLIEMTWGSVGIPFSIPKELASYIDIGVIEYPSYRIFQIAATALLALGLWLFLRGTRIGLVIRAGVQDRQMVESLGVNVNNVFTLTFCLGVGIAGLAGVVSAPLFSLYPAMGNDILIKCFVVVILGGIGSFKGAVYSGLILGMASSISTIVWLPLADIVIYLFMAAFLLLKPGGLFGE